MGSHYMCPAPYFFLLNNIHWTTFLSSHGCTLAVFTLCLVFPCRDVPFPTHPRHQRAVGGFPGFCFLTWCHDGYPSRLALLIHPMTSRARSEKWDCQVAEPTFWVSVDQTLYFLHLPQSYEEQELLRLIYYGGIQPEIRKAVWPFLLGHYQFGMTETERKEVGYAWRAGGLWQQKEPGTGGMDMLWFRVGPRGRRGTWGSREAAGQCCPIETQPKPQMALCKINLILREL